MPRDLAKWPQWPTFTSLQKEMNRLLDDFLGREDLYRPGNYPLLDISETSDIIIVKAELPGLGVQFRMI